MQELRCKARKPNGEMCNALLLKAEFEGELEVKCYRCNAYNVYDRRPALTASS